MLRPGALGDTLLAVPALRALRRQYGTVTLAAHGPSAALLQTCGEVDRGLAFDDPRLAWLFGASRSPADVGRADDVVAWLRQEPCVPAEHLVVQAPGRPDPDSREHCAAYLLRTLPSAAAPSFDITLSLSVLARRTHRTDEVLVHPGSGAAAKNWAPEKFAECIRRLEGPVRLVVGEADAAAAQAVEAALGRSVPRLAGSGLRALAEALAGCRAYLGNDSGVSHLAGLCGTRTVAVFGPTSPEVWRPLGPRVTVASFATSPSEVVALLQADARLS